MRDCILKAIRTPIVAANKLIIPAIINSIAMMRFPLSAAFQLRLFVKNTLGLGDIFLKTQSMYLDNTLNIIFN
jgi:hypothetical protein